MRYLVGFLCVCALGAMPLVGCSEEAPPECLTDEECDDQNACTDDGCNAGSCDYIPNDARCDFDGLGDFYEGLDGICMSGVCEENPCDDGNVCTYDPPPAPDGSCVAGPTCSGCRPCDWNGEPGVCRDGVCAEDVCLSLVCDDGNECTDDWCGSHVNSHNGGPYFHDGCFTTPKNCADSNPCTDDTCDDPDTGDCNHTTTPDGEYCCLQFGECCNFWPSYCYSCCKNRGECLDAVCV